MGSPDLLVKRKTRIIRTINYLPVSISHLVPARPPQDADVLVLGRPNNF